ncbi:LMBL4 protein, partial [Amia calva]|nr:LMBL4 protein [Amia calva]
MYRNGFKVGMRLEGIDPLHPSMFCVLSVAEVIGYRLRLHFDGYSECYDFWVNADSPEIRPSGWCEMTGRKLQPPKGYKEDEFNWSKYLEACKAQAAPNNLFKNQNNTVIPSRVQVGMKLEAVDRKNPYLVCVASIADIIDHRFLVHFDNWDDTYDYWCDASSPHIHPVGWCQDNGRPLTAPQGHPNPEKFFWEEYLEDTISTAVPNKAFNVRPPHKFQVNMKLEAVDKRNPMLMRVATIIDTEDYRIKSAHVLPIQVHFDGWHHKFDFWIDSDMPDIHPAGWCARTGHPLEMPLRPADLKTTTNQGVCPTPGCRGVGHIKGARYTGHHSAFGCPYSEINMKKEVTLQDRLGGEKQITFVPVHFAPKTKRLCSADEHEKPEEYMETRPINTISIYFIKSINVTYSDLQSFIPHVSIQGMSTFKQWSSTFRQLQSCLKPLAVKAQWKCLSGTGLCRHSSGFIHSLRGSVCSVEITDYCYSNCNTGVNTVPQTITSECEADKKERRRKRESKGESCLRRSEKIIDKHGKGKGYKTISKQLDVPVTTVANIKKSKVHGTVANLPGLNIKYGINNDGCQVSSYFRGNYCNADSMQQALHQSVFLSAMSTHPSRDLPLCWEQHCKLLPGVAGVQASRVAHWTVDEVAGFVHSLPGCEEQAKQFKDEQIDGEAFLLLTQTDIVKIMCVKLGPALKIYNSILMFKNAEDSQSGNSELNT